MTLSVVRSYSGTIRQLARQHGVTRVRVFGSHARGVATARSDLDLLIRMAPGKDLLDLIEFKLAVESLTKCPVDVVSERGLSPYLRRRILREARSL